MKKRGTNSDPAPVYEREERWDDRILPPGVWRMEIPSRDAPRQAVLESEKMTGGESSLQGRSLSAFMKMPESELYNYTGSREVRHTEQEPTAPPVSPKQS